MEFGIICLTFMIPDVVYASALINYGTKWSGTLISFNASNASGCVFDSRAKTLSCNITTKINEVRNIKSFLIK